MEGMGGCGMSDLNFTKGSLDVLIQRGVLTIVVPMFSSIVVPNECFCPCRATIKFSNSNVGDVKTSMWVQKQENISREKEKNKKGSIFAGKRPGSALGGSGANWKIRQVSPR